MAKMIIHDLTKELTGKGIKVDNKSVIAFLESKGIMGKLHSSAIEDKEADLVRKQFDRSQSSGQADTKTAKTAETHKAAETMKAHETEKTQEVQKEAPDARPVQQASEPPKKKKFLFVTNAANSRNGMNSGKHIGNISAGRIEDPFARRQVIKPSIKPSPTPEVNIIRPGQQTAGGRVKPAEDNQAERQTAAADRADTDRAAGTVNASNVSNTADKPGTENASGAVNNGSAVKNDQPVKNAEADKNVQSRSVSDETQQVRQPAAPQSTVSSQHAPAQNYQRTSRPENSGRTYTNSGRGDRPQGSYSQGGYSQGGYSQNRSSYQDRQRSQGSYSQNRTGSYQGSRPNGNGPRQGGYSSNGQSGSGRPYGSSSYSQGSGRSYQGSGSYQGGGSYQGRTGGYNGNRTQGSYSGSRPYGQSQGGYGQNRDGAQGYSRPYGAGGNSQNRFGGPSRPGFKTGGPGKGKDFATTDVPKDAEKHRSDADRRRQNEARRRKEANYDAADEENERKKLNPHRFIKPAAVEKAPEEEIKVITLPDTLTIKELADHMKLQPSVIIKKLFLSGQIVTVNSEISYEDAENIAIDYDIMCEHEKKIDVIADLLSEDEEDEDGMEKRPPVVCVMGHVDHGKTSLLDTIRKSHVTEREAGGITQAIGAYTVSINGRKITFLDTPGHEAFTAMRMRGANATDIVILVVAADDGVMPQTVEAINHAKAANVEIIVAVNKIDKPNANIDRVKQELAEYELIPEDWGGKTIFVPVSAKAGTGVNELLEMILLTADMLELKANPHRQARGLVIEAELDKGRGPVATVLVQKGTLHVGDFVACGSCHGKVRAMLDEKGRRVKEAGPSIPVEILGLDDVPEAGEIFVSPETDKEAQDFANTYKAQHKKELLNETKKKTMTLDDLYSQIKEGDLKEFNVIIKADVQGSVEALKQSLLKLTNDEVAVKVIHGGVGAINESDVILASASNAIIIGFNVRPDATAKATAETENVDIHLYKIIYQAIDDVEAAMKGMLAPVYEEKVIGHGEIRQVFKASGIGNIAGSYVLDGSVERGCSVRISREGEQIFDGALASLKRFKDDAKEVKEGYECGLVFEDFDKVQEGDTLEFYKQVEVART